jgi:hypothetical protein
VSPLTNLGFFFRVVLFTTTCNTHRLYTIQTAPKFYFIDYFWSWVYIWVLAIFCYMYILRCSKHWNIILRSWRYFNLIVNNKRNWKWSCFFFSILFNIESKISIPLYSLDLYMKNRKSTMRNQTHGFTYVHFCIDNLV